MGLANGQNALGVVVVPGNEWLVAGALVLWRLSGVTDDDQLGAAWSRAGLDRAMLPKETSLKDAMRIAVQKQVAKHRLVRRTSTGWQIVDERELASSDDLEWTPTCKVKLDKVGRLDIRPADHALAPAIRAAYDLAQETLSTNRTSSWLVSLVHHCRGVSITREGGMYFIPNALLPVWRTMTGAIREATMHSTYEIPAMTADDVVRLVLDAVVDEATKLTTIIETELDTGDLGRDALATRYDKIVAVCAKAETYEALLDNRLDKIRERLITLQASITEAALAKGDDQ